MHQKCQPFGCCVSADVSTKIEFSVQQGQCHNFVKTRTESTLSFLMTKIQCHEFQLAHSETVILDLSGNPVFILSEVLWNMSTRSSVDNNALGELRQQTYQRRWTYKLYQNLQLNLNHPPPSSIFVIICCHSLQFYIWCTTCFHSYFDMSIILPQTCFPRTTPPPPHCLLQLTLFPSVIVWWPLSRLWFPPNPLFTPWLHLGCASLASYPWA